MTDRIALAARRFAANTARVTRLAVLATSGKEPFKPVAFWTYDGESADLFRMCVLGLQVAVEDVVRTFLPVGKKFTFSSTSDIFKALSKAGYNIQPLLEIQKPLQQLALRRHKIVHFGDLSDEGELEKWTITDSWLLLQWQITVMLFVFLFFPIVDPSYGPKYAENAKIARDAMAKHIEFGHAVIKLPEEIHGAANDKDAVTKALAAIGERLSAVSKLVLSLQKV
jgi:hypothetical protein